MNVKGRNNRGGGRLLEEEAGNPPEQPAKKAAFGGLVGQAQVRGRKRRGNNVRVRVLS